MAILFCESYSSKTQENRVFLRGKLVDWSLRQPGAEPAPCRADTVILPKWLLHRVPVRMWRRLREPSHDGNFPVPKN